MAVNGSAAASDDGRLRAAAAALDAGSGRSRSRERRERERKDRDAREQGGDSDDDFAAALSKIKGEIVSELNNSTTKLLDDKLDKTAVMLKNYTDRKCDKMDAKVEKIQKEVEGLGARQGCVEADHKGMWAAINDMQKALAINETSSRQFPAGASNDTEHNDTADGTILRINTDNLVEYDALLVELRGLCDGAGIKPDQYKLTGGRLARRFTLVFSGEENLACRRAKKVHQSLRKPEGGWHRVTVRRPDEASEDVYISPDKKYSHIQREQGCKLLRDILAEHDTAGTYVAVKKEFAVTKDWAVLATVEYNTTNKSTFIKWNEGVATEKQVPTEEINQRYSAKIIERAARAAERRMRG